jgi:release factor glutamine methyltransferase
MTDIQSTLSDASDKLANISDSAMLDAEILLCHVLDKPRSHLRAWPEKKLSPDQQLQFLNLFKQRQQGVPVAYLIGSREFWSREFKVDSAVLIPRPDTELLIELSLELLDSKPNPQIIDLGTGSGIIAITLAAERPDIVTIATDFSEQALNIAKQNSVIHQTINIQFILSDWFTNVPQSKFDLVISNPPYIDGNDPHLSQGDVRFEPDSALISEEQGLKDIKAIADNARHYLKQNGTLLIEHGCDQQAAVQAIFDLYNYSNTKTHTDLSGNPRVTTAQWNAE